MDYILLDNDDKIFSQCEIWNTLDRIAVDFEGEFNLHVYGEHLCLVQVYDGKDYFIIDPRSTGVTPKGLEAFFSSKVKKVWFDCQSDHSLVFKCYNLKISNISDIRIMAKALDYSGNLLGLVEKYLGINISINKKKNQQANWMRRPLDEELIEYALLDVAHLMELEDILAKEVEEKGLANMVAAQMKRAVQVKKPAPGWTRIGVWKHYSPLEKAIVKNVFLARDALAKRFNVPAARVMDKKRIIELALNPPKSKDMLDLRLIGESPRFKNLLIPKVWEAIEKAKTEFRETP